MSRVLVLSICVLILQFSSIIASKSSLQTYIVHVDLPDIKVSSDESYDIESYYQSFMPTTTTTAGVSEPRRIIYSYRHVISGFAAKLTSDDVKEMSKKSGFISARPEKILSLHTTHTPNFLGLNQGSGFWAQANYGKGQIVCVMDTGITWDHPSFHDAGMSPPPSKWKGKCNFGTSGGKCNNKLIGARHFSDGDGTPIDREGHGTHTASTAAGSYVSGANINGLANGTAAGVAPLAHLAIYKVCTENGCSDSNTLGGMDAAIEDGCDVISLSLGGAPQKFHVDSVAIGAFSAMKKKIFVSCSAGNDGPSAKTVSNEAPWILTVAASTHDRKLVSTAVLGNGQELNGETAYQPSNFPSTQLPLVYPTDPYCTSLNSGSVKGKIVVCQLGKIGSDEKGKNVRNAGGLGMIVPNVDILGYSTFSEANYIPATNIDYEGAKKLSAYTKSTASPTAAIKFKGTIIGDKNAPEMTYFSSRGPSTTTPGILKPDITGPGVNIFAAWPSSVEVNPPTTKKNFNIISGTSMSCPHLSGVATLIKSVHPTWSPAAIKSAMMTTADTLNLGKQPIIDERHLPADLFATGAGHVNPAKASDPGLVYDNEPIDYLPYLCGLGYTNKQIKTITKENWSCSTSILEGQLNYPSFTVRLRSPSTQTFTRTVTNVGDANEEYTAEVSPPSGVKVVVEPPKLKFTQVNQKQTYKVTFTKSAISGTSQGYIIWKSTKHTVRSPIVVY